jgi:hypothetical protein
MEQITMVARKSTRVQEAKPPPYTVVHAEGRGKGDVVAMHVRVPGELHHKMRVYCAHHRITLRDCVLDAIGAKVGKIKV